MEERIEHFEFDFSQDDPEFKPLPDMDEFMEKSAYLSGLYPEVSCMEFYRDMFPEGSLRSLDPETKGKGNAVIGARNGDGHLRHYVVFDDLAFIEKYMDSDFAIVAPASFFGRKPDGLHLHEVFGFAIDIDFVHPANLRTIVHQIEHNIIPEPTYIVNSGHGVHAYYLLDEPVPAFSNMKRRLNDFKYALTVRVANQYNSAFLKESQKKTSDMLWVGQGMRVVGGNTKFGNLGPEYKLRAFRTGDKVSLNYLNQFVPEEYALEDLYYEPKKAVPLEEAKELWPEWYARKIKQKSAPRWQWNVSRDVYEWWKQKIVGRDGAVVGTRYFCTMCLAIYARKCNVPYDELYADAKAFQEMFNAMDPEGNPFTVEDMEVALRGHRRTYNTFPIKDIKKLTRIEFDENKRNGRSQELHLRIARATRDVLYPDGSWRHVPETKKEAILAYATEHPDATQREIAAALGCSPTTVNKWLKLA